MFVSNYTNMKTTLTNSIKKIAAALLMLISTQQLSAQLANGTIAPDFTITDLNGTTHNLYTYLAAGKTVYIDFFACHCPSCWAYHNTHAMNDLYNHRGPSGTLSQNVIVIAIEYDANNGLNEFNGISGSTQGNWLSGTNHPTCNPEGTLRTQIISAYNVVYYPMVYAICPNKQVTLIGTQNETTLYNHVSTCVTTGINESTLIDNSITLFPNPSSNLVQLNINHSLSSINAITIIDVNGKVVLDIDKTAIDSAFDTSLLDNGFYTIVVETTEGKLTKKFIKTN
jgi:Secretion system C-terminal sorting domain/AhpC/TSA family